MSEPAPSAVLSEAEARALTDRIKASLKTTWQDIAEAYLKRADRVLGYSSWDAYALDEFGSSPLRVPLEDRPEIVRSLRSKEMSLRAIATALGVSERTVRRDLDEATAANAAVEPIATVVGRDGRRQPAARRNPRPERPAAPPTPLEVVWEPAPLQPPPSRNYAMPFEMSACLLRLKARELARLHEKAKDEPGPFVDRGVWAVRQAVETLQAILAADS